MLRRMLLPVLVLAVIQSLVAPGRGDPQPGDDWKYDVVHRKKGHSLSGLIIEQNATHIVLRCIIRRAGSPTVTIRESLPLVEVERIDRLNDEDRELLSNRLKNLARERETLAAQLKLLEPGARHDPTIADHVTLTPAEWVQKDRGPGLEYREPHFHLLSNSRDAVVQLVAIQMEQVYAAYRQNLPPRVPAGRPTTILLARDAADYQALVRARGGNFTNPAFYDVERNQIVCYSGLERLHDELEKIRKAHAKALADLDERRAELNELYKGKIPNELLVAFGEDRIRIKAQEEQNANLYQRAKQRLFRRLYHEAFHAYLANFVYPPESGEIPRWLNEGLAQIFETAIIEAGDLRVGHVERERYETIRQIPARTTLMPLTELLRSGERDFLVAHPEDRQASDRAYLVSWALAHYLTFDRKLLGTPALDNYVRDLKRGTDPLLAFRDLIDQPLDRFEKEFHTYVQRLRQDGTVLPR